MKREEAIADTMRKKFARKVLQIDLTGNVLSCFPSISNAAKTTRIKTSNISICCRKNEKSKIAHTAGGYIWRFL